MGIEDRIWDEGYVSREVLIGIRVIGWGVYLGCFIWIKRIVDVSCECKMLGDKVMFIIGNFRIGLGGLFIYCGVIGLVVVMRRLKNG